VGRDEEGNNDPLGEYLPDMAILNAFELAFQQKSNPFCLLQAGLLPCLLPTVHLSAEHPPSPTTAAPQPLEQPPARHSGQTFTLYKDINKCPGMLQSLALVLKAAAFLTHALSKGQPGKV